MFLLANLDKIFLLLFLRRQPGSVLTLKVRGHLSINPKLNQQLNARNVPLGHIRGLEQLTTIYVVISAEDMTWPWRVLVVNSARNSGALARR